ncbi:putative telomere and ribosome associated protein Stm1 [Aspergillus candidus]|uniref:Stm1-domain-containing protein n=1 Tax=Aspergillus candidus TaxID=41067 RepID=A0A2I2F654_ASPCN|nr:Stm1-domain-containing protein [Aspergillus candidus]PLB36124.1 Stm1-domain-containing protein [Aspergillus candidus]
MADVRSKNLYELLGNDPELDPNRAPEPPTRAIDKPIARSGKRDAPKEPVSQAPAETNNRRGGRATGNEAAFRDRNAGRGNNREKTTEETQGPRRQRGDRAPRDRQSRTGQTGTRKQVAQGWGGQSGEKELADEKAGEKIAHTEEAEPQTPGEAEEAAEKTMSLSDYLAEKAAQGDLSAKPVRAANEGSQLDKKWASAKEIKRGEEEQEYFKGKEEKARREKQRKEKTFLDVDLRFVEPPRAGGSAPRGRGGRGGARGGAPRGGRGNGPRGGDRAGPAPGAAPAVSVDEKNFPSLGGK